MKEPDEKLGVWIVNKSFYGLGFGERGFDKSRCRLSLPGDLILITSIELGQPDHLTRERVNFVWDTGVVDFVWNYFNNGEFHLFKCLIRPPRTE